MIATETAAFESREQTPPSTAADAGPAASERALPRGPGAGGALAGAAAGGEWQPRIVAFLCNWCSYTGADLAGISRIPWSPAVRVVRVMCTGRVDPTWIVQAFRLGADGVIVSGCHPGDCHYLDGNRKALRRVHLLRRLLADFGIEPERLRLASVSASEGEQWARVASETETEIRRLGPLRLEP